jgi:hypothetical protein
MVQSYSQALDLWGSKKRKLANNTYLVCCETGPQGSDGDPYWLGIKLHNTVVVKFHRDGGPIELDSGGWLTVTTKERMNGALPVKYGVYSEKGIWYVVVPRRNGEPRHVPFADGIKLYPDGAVTGEGSDPRAALKLRKGIQGYVKRYMAAFWNGEVPAPGPGDCFACLGILGTGGADHIRSHIEERYFVPSLLASAIKRFPVSQWGQHVVACFWNPVEREAQGIALPTRNGGLEGVAERQLGKALKRYLYEQIGTGS